MKTLKEVIKIIEYLENQKIHVHLQCSKKTKVLTVPYGTIKSKKLWQQQIGQSSQEEKTTEK